VPPDAIGGFVTRGKGVAVHRSDCRDFRHMASTLPDRVLEVAWEGFESAGERQPGSASVGAPLSMPPSMSSLTTGVDGSKPSPGLGAATDTRAAGSTRPRVYPVDITIEADDRQGLLRDVSDVFTRERVNVTGVNTRSVVQAGSPTAFMTFTVEVPDATRAAQVLRQVTQVAGVRRANRR
jgi:GTP pyrophosphokinase